MSSAMGGGGAEGAEGAVGAVGEPRLRPDFFVDLLVDEKLLDG